MRLLLFTDSVKMGIKEAKRHYKSHFKIASEACHVSSGACYVTAPGSDLAECQTSGDWTSPGAQ